MTKVNTLVSDPDSPYSKEIHILWSDTSEGDICLSRIRKPKPTPPTYLISVERILSTDTYKELISRYSGENFYLHTTGYSILVNNFSAAVSTIIYLYHRGYARRSPDLIDWLYETLRKTSSQEDIIPMLTTYKEDNFPALNYGIESWYKNSRDESSSPQLNPKEGPRMKSMSQMSLVELKAMGLALINLADSNFAKEIQSVHRISNQRIAEALARKLEKRREETEEAAAEHILNLLEEAEEHRASARLQIRGLKTQIKKLVNKLSEIDRAEAYGNETMNHVPLAALLGTRPMIFALVTEHGVDIPTQVPDDWKPQNSVPNPAPEAGNSGGGATTASK